jgi:hypothetical protein
VTCSLSDASDGTPTVSGNGLTWTNKHYTESGTGHLTMLFEGSAEASPSAGVTTVTLAGTDGANDWHYTIFQSDKYQTFVQAATGSASNSTVTGPTATLSAAKNDRNLIYGHSVWRHSGETGGPYPRGAGGIAQEHWIDLDERDLGTISTAIDTMWLPDSYDADGDTTFNANRTTPGETVRKTMLVAEIAPVDDEINHLGSGDWTGTATAPRATDSVTSSADYDTWIAFYAQATTASDGDPTVSGLGHTWTKKYGVTPDGGTQRHLYVFKGTGGSGTTGAVTVTMAGTDLMDEFVWCLDETPSAWTETQTKSHAGTNSTVKGPTTVTNTFAASTAADTRCVVAFTMMGFRDKQIAPAAPLEWWSLNHDQDVGSVGMMIDYNGGAYTDTEVTIYNSAANYYQHGLFSVEFATVTQVNKIVSEVLNIVEGTAKVFGLPKVVSEVLNMVESTVKFYGFNKVVSEALNMVEAAVKVREPLKIVNETLNMVESTPIWRHFRRVVDEVLNMTEGTVKGTVATLVRILYDTILATRTLYEAGLSATRTLYDTLR